VISIPADTLRRERAAALQKGEKRAQDRFLKELEVTSLEEARTFLAERKKEKEPPARKEPPQPAAVEEEDPMEAILPRKKGESDRAYLARVIRTTQEGPAEKIKELQDLIEELKGGHEARTERELAAERAAAWEQFDEFAQAGGCKPNMRRAVRALAQQFVDDLDDETADKLNDSPEGRKLWEEMFFKPLREESPELFKSAETATDPPEEKKGKKPPATTGTRGSDVKEPKPADANRSAEQVSNEATRKKILDPKTSNADVDAEIRALITKHTPAR
jgi:hypothetical protein